MIEWGAPEITSDVARQKSIILITSLYYGVLVEGDNAHQNTTNER